MPKRSRDQVWAEQAAAGDKSAFRALYRAHVRPVYWIAHGIVGSTTDAEDAVQETFVAAWRKLPGLTLAGSRHSPGSRRSAASRRRIGCAG